MNTESPRYLIRVHLLGGFRVSIVGEEIPAKRFRLHKARSLIKILALAPKHQLHREQIMEQLWPDFEPQFAAANLRQTIYIARRTLGANDNQLKGILTTQDEILSLGDPVDVWVDVEAFENAAAWARWSKDVASIQSALSLYTGDLLPEDCYEDWCSVRRESLRQEYLSLLLELAGIHTEYNEYPQAIQALQQVLAAEPEREEAHVALMRLYALSGQRSLAVRQYETLQETLSRELDAEPDTASTQLYHEILSGSFPAGSEMPSIHRPGASSVAQPLQQHNLPVRLSSFIGREQETEAVQRALESARLVTLTGAGGVGKSSLAIRCAWMMLQNYAHGAWLVELASLSDPQLLPQVIDGILHLRPDEHGDFLSALQYYLAEKQLLLVLDNCEHLIAACTSLAEILLKTCPHLTILATSRERLGIQGEQVYLVPSLTIPEERQGLALADYPIFESVQLFAERARAALPGFELSLANAPAVAAICRRLDGIPLAIELAAARIPLLRAEQIAARLQNRFQLLTNGERTALPRHQTLRASIDWSYNLLSAEEQLLLRRLSVFAGGWTLEAAEFVCSVPDADQINQSTDYQTTRRPDDRTAFPSTASQPHLPSIQPSVVLDLLAGLVQKSLVLAGRTPGSETRYGMLETVRQYSREKLEQGGESPLLRQRHLEYYLQLGEAGKATPTSDWMESLLRLKPERDNFRAALSWALDETPEVNAEPGLRLANAFLSAGKRIDPQGPPGANLVEFLDWAGKGLERLAENGQQDSLARAEALIWMGGISYSHDGYRMAQEGVSIYRNNPHANPRELAWALSILSQLATIVERKASLGRALADESLAILTGTAQTGGWDLAFAYCLTCIAALWGEDYAGAHRDAQRAYDLFARENDLSYTATALRFLALTAQAQGEPAAARSHYEAGLDLLHQVPAAYEELIVDEMRLTLTYSADFEDEAGNYSAALERYRALLEIGREHGQKNLIANATARIARLSALRREEQAIGALHQALNAARDTKADYDLSRAVQVFAEVYIDYGQPRIAAVLLGALEFISLALNPSTRKQYRQCLDTTQVMLGEEAFAAAFAEGKAMTLEQAGDYAEAMLAKLETGQDLTTKYTKDNTKDTN